MKSTLSIINPCVGRLCLVAVCLAFVGCMRQGFIPFVAEGDGGQGPDGPRLDGPRLDGPGTDGPGTEAGPPPLAGIVGAWPLDNGSGQVVSAAAGNAGYLGTKSTADPADPTWDKTPSRICSGAALTFDGGDDVVTIPGASPAALSRFTISFSLYVTGPGGGALPRILTKEDGSDTDTLVHYRSLDKAIAVNMFDTTDKLYATFAVGVVSGQRANWALTYDDAGDRLLHVYKNGKETTYLRQDKLSGTLRTTTNPWRIGNHAAGARGFDGTVDDVRVFGRVLSPAEILALSNLCSP